MFVLKHSAVHFKPLVRNYISRSEMLWIKVFLLFYLVQATHSKKIRSVNRGDSIVRDGNHSKAFQREILNLMGLPKRPRPPLHIRLYGKKLSAPRFMLDLYKSLSKNDSEQQGFCCNGTLTDQRAAGADTIMSFPNHIRVAYPRTSHYHAIFKFKIPPKPQGEDITAAEFRIFKEAVRSKSFDHWTNVTFTVNLYQVVKPARTLFLLQKKVLFNWESGWQVFDISQALQSWTRPNKPNYGLEFSVETMNGEKKRLGHAGFVNFHGAPEKRPFIVAFFQWDGGHRSVTYRTFQTFQGPFSLTKDTLRKRRSLNSQWNSAPAGSPSRTTSANRKCQRRALYVSFRDLGWTDWVIAPEGYSAFFCNGDCSFPLETSMNSTNHAIVQTLVHLMNPRTVPKPCCAPTKTNSISVLYFDDSNDVILKKYQDMVVKSCGCH